MILDDINIIYEDNHVLVVNKPINIPVCEDSSHDLDLLTMLKKYIKDKYNKPGNVYLGLVHRLDRPVGGVMVFAKTSKASSRLAKQIQEHKMDKVYYAVINGKIDSEGEMVDYLYKDKINNMSYVTDKDKGKEARLKYRRIGYNKDYNYSLVEVYLYTGRSHQIRVQFASRGYPLVGDHKYGKDRDNKTNIALFSHKLSFVHPISKEILNFNIDIPNRYPFDLF
ncbi:MAG: RluA family pseudouridine synthase [Bacilli bacterium]|nr:RluA family pseudouridine synthase [Bacilli bacterium]